MADAKFSPRLLKALSALKVDDQRFVTEYLSNGEKSTEAFEAIWPGRKGVRNLAYSRLKRQDIKRVIEIAREEAANAAGVDLVSHIEMLKKIRDQAMEGERKGALAAYKCKHCGKENRVKALIKHPNMIAAARAEELIGRASGLHVEKHQLVPGENLNADYLAKELAQDTDGAVQEVLAKVIDGEPMDAQRMMAIAQRYIRGAA